MSRPRLKRISKKRRNQLQAVESEGIIQQGKFDFSVFKGKKVRIAASASLRGSGYLLVLVGGKENDASSGEEVLRFGPGDGSDGAQAAVSEPFVREGIESIKLCVVGEPTLYAEDWHLRVFETFQDGSSGMN